ITEWEVKKDALLEKLHTVKRRTRFFDSDPAAQTMSRQLETVLDNLDRLKALAAPATAGADPYDTLLQNKKEEIRQKEEKARELLVAMQESMPTHQKFLDKLDKLKEKNEQCAEMERKIWQFNGISAARKEPVIQLAPVVEPTIPVRPRRLI